MILSIPSSTKLYTCSTAPRVSVSHSASSISYSVKYGGNGARRRSRLCSCLVFFASNQLGMTKVLDDKKCSSSSISAAAAVVAFSSTSDQHEISPARTFLDVPTGQDLLMVICKEAEAGRLPVTVAKGMEELYHNYRNAVLQSGHPKADEIVLSNMSVVLDRIFLDVRDPFQFSPYHKAIREPFDYYTFGQKYIRPLLDFRTSFVGNISLFSEIEKKLEQGENIILISNHQTEADPAVIALMLESTNPFIAENMIFVAGDRVITDPLCKPFSMGRNLLCVYSKKHMNDDPELLDMKKRANTKSLKEMALLLRIYNYDDHIHGKHIEVQERYVNVRQGGSSGRGGSKIIWIAPSGGRDRPDPATKEWYPAPFDASAVDNMRRLVEHAGSPGYVYPLAILCHDIMPPPPQVEKDIGEKRLISFHGVGLSVAPSINCLGIASTFEDPEEAKIAYTESLYSSVCEQYNVLNSAIHGKQGLKASTPIISLSQPWE